MQWDMSVEAERERKVISALFCDVAGFTQRAELLDPEDVHRLLRPYFASARGELERFGGTVEKFIGDAVCALFGAPRAHGDDQERAVRAALAVRDSVAELNKEDPKLDLHVRLGIATGEAVVELGARPTEGEGMAWGDVLNTAFRLQAAAPVDGILVDEATYRATRHVIEYGEAEPVQVKGKAEPILVWRAIAARGRRGVDLSLAGREPLVGRLAELAALLDSLERVGRDRAPELVTIVGEPGIGKSRLVFELFRQIELSSALITWRQARSSPYGDGFTLWALGEIVKAQAGILETDGAAVASQKLGRTVRDLVSAPADAARIEAHLRSLVGLSASADASGGRREAAFAAWRHFLEAVARERTLVLVFEDIHWGDDALLDFVEYLLEWSRDVRLLVVCTARPGIVEERPAWGEGENARTLFLSPLSEDETAELVAELAADAIPTEMATAIVGAASGNPLYAVEFVRMLEDRGLLWSSETDFGKTLGRPLPIPESIQSLIAARIDSLSAEDKALLQSAAVVGKVVWPGALATVGDRSRWSVERHLDELERKEFLIRGRHTSVEREPEYRFRHVLMRDVAYSQIPRSRRGEAHTRAGLWLESLSPDRATDRAEMLAHHYLAAYELAVADGGDTSELSERARLFLRDAGDRALSLNSFAAAARYFRDALDLWPEPDSERSALLLRLGTSLHYAEPGNAADVLLQAEEGLRAIDPEAAAEAATLLADLAQLRGEPQERVFEHAYRARGLVESVKPSRPKLEVLLDLAFFLVVAAEHEQAIALAREALRDAEALGLAELQARAFATMGIARGLSGDPEGRSDLQRSIAIAEEIDSSLGSHHCAMLADLEFNLGNLNECFALQARARRHAERFGHTAHIQWLRAEQVAESYWTGRWDVALTLADEFIRDAEAGSGHFMEGYCRDVRGRILLARGNVAGALNDSVRALNQARASNELQMLYPALALHARALAASDAPAEATKVADELLALWRSKPNRFPASSWVFDLVCALESLGRAGDVLGAADAVATKTAWLEAALAFTRGDYEVAADLFCRIGSRPDEAFARLRAAETLLEAESEVKASVQLERALSFYRDVEASTYVRQAEAVLVAERALVTEATSTLDSAADGAEGGHA
jgi:class 3 adenylate cyclase/tetratricopeptide (TPR) repeat protein